LKGYVNSSLLSMDKTNSSLLNLCCKLKLIIDGKRNAEHMMYNLTSYYKVALWVGNVKDHTPCPVHLERTKALDITF